MLIRTKVYRLQHRAGLRFNTSYLHLAESCVFDKQSPLPALCPCIHNHYATRPLLPKLRGYFAEFLQHYYPDHLGILYQSTCVQFRVRSVLYILYQLITYNIYFLNAMLTTNIYIHLLYICAAALSMLLWLAFRYSHQS